MSIVFWYVSIAGGDRVVVVAEHHAGVVVQHVQAAEGLHRVLHRVLHRGLVGDVAGDVGGLATGGGDRLHDVVAVGHVGDDHLRALLGEALGARRARVRMMHQ